MQETAHLTQSINTLFQLYESINTLFQRNVRAFGAANILARQRARMLIFISGGIGGIAAKSRHTLVADRHPIWLRNLLPYQNVWPISITCIEHNVDIREV